MSEYFPVVYHGLRSATWTQRKRKPYCGVVAESNASSGRDLPSRVIIDVQDLTFRYGSVSVLERISFTVREGEYLGVIGPNGGGKTTLIKILLGLLRPSEGDVKIFGVDVREFREGYRIGYVPQRLAHADPHFPATVREMVSSGRTPRVGLFRRFTHTDRDAVEHAMRTANVHELHDRRMDELSGGQRQRVFIARALAAEPQILILDEPTVGVDPSSQETFYSFLAELNTKHHITILFVTHDIDVIAQEAKSVLCLNHGLICHGSPKDFIREEYMERLYGKRGVKFVLHEHPHDHA